MNRTGYLFSLKANRPAMLADVEAFFAAPDTRNALNWHETVDGKRSADPTLRQAA